MVNPRKLCRQHLLGEHNEIHKFVGALNKDKSLDGYKPFIEIHNLRARHDALVKEMLQRGYRHESPLAPFTRRRWGHINRNRALMDLRKRCKNCFKPS